MTYFGFHKVLCQVRILITLIDERFSTVVDYSLEESRAQRPLVDVKS
jgi:hypothetical protein